ncbi:MAG: sulfatase-like hydrolase/transferase [Eubacterium sp.]|nr:sulfatase-like hydrolase/transferase [Eubacterium sp.]
MSSKKNRKHHNNNNKNYIDKKKQPEKTVVEDAVEEVKKAEEIEVPKPEDGFVKTEDLEKLENKEEVSKESDEDSAVKIEEESEEESEESAPEVKGPFKKLKMKISALYEARNYKWIFACFILAVVEDVILEILGRRSFVGAVKFIVHSPLIFFINILIIFGSLLLGLLFRKRLFFVFIFGFLWFVMGFINFILLGYRITPFSAIDFLMAMDVISMMDIYFSKFQQILIYVGIGVAVFFVVMLYIWTPKIIGKVNRLVNFLVAVGVFMLIYVLTTTATRLGIISDDFSNLGNAYRDYGFAYCFSNSIIDIGISKPDNYSEEEVDGLVERVDSDYQLYLRNRGRKQTPNIIIIQLESFMDISRMQGIHTDIDSVPNFNKFMEEYPSGFLTVPSIGAGTANVECEVITGMRTSMFGAGEYPYKTVLTDTPCESLAQILGRQGYTSFAMHNNKAYFYSRHEVYNELGFDYFVSQEYMPHLSYTSAGWAKDYDLVDEIKKCLDHTETDDDFIHCISVQGHGKYPEDAVNTVEHVHVTRDDGDTVLENQYGYYVNMCYEMDEMIGMLKDMLDERGEDYVLFIYGDHLPSIPFEMSDIVVGNELQSEYVIVNNIGLDLPDRDMATYEFSDYLLTALNMDKGIYQKIHSSFYNPYDDTAYNDALHLIQYDMLYGEQYIYDSIEEYKPKNMMMGIYPVVLKDVVLSNNQIIVHGNNFTPFSTVVVNGERLVTTYMNENTIIVAREEFDELKTGDVVAVYQIDLEKHVLSTSINELIYDAGY